MRVAVKKWGNSASIRIPSAILQAANLDFDALVDIREEDGRIVIVPIRDPKIDLNDLLDGITAENTHGEADFGDPIGSEAL